MRYLLSVSLLVGLSSGWPTDRQFRIFGGFMDPVEFDMAGPGESETDLQSYILSSQMAGSDDQGVVLT